MRITILQCLYIVQHFRTNRLYGIQYKINKKHCLAAGVDHHLNVDSEYNFVFSPTLTYLAATTSIGTSNQPVRPTPVRARQGSGEGTRPPVSPFFEIFLYLLQRHI